MQRRTPESERRAMLYCCTSIIDSIDSINSIKSLASISVIYFVMGTTVGRIRDSAYCSIISRRCALCHAILYDTVL